MMNPLSEKELPAGAGPGRKAASLPRLPETAWPESRASMFIIHLESDPLWRIIQKALIHYLRAGSPAKNLLKRFYNPAEQALIEAAMDFCGRNQIRCASMLGLNRNTLRKKFDLCGMAAKNSDRRESFFLKFPAGREIFLSQLSAIDLLEASRAKMFVLRQTGAFSHWEASSQELNPEGLIKKICGPVELAIIKTALQAFENRLMKTAQSLGINRNTLKSKLRAYSIYPLSEEEGALS